MFHTSQLCPLPTRNGWFDHIVDSGIIINGSGNILRNSTIAYSAGNGVSLPGNNNTVQNNLIHHIDYVGNFCSGISLQGSSQVVRNNTIYMIGRHAILPNSLTTGTQPNDDDVSHNNMFDAMTLTRDGGEIYVGEYSNVVGTRIHHNWFHDTQSLVSGPADNYPLSALYLDEDAAGFEFDQNVLWNNQYDSIILDDFPGFTTPNNNNVHNNTIPDVSNRAYILLIDIPFCGTTQITNNLVLVPVQVVNAACPVTNNNAMAPGATEMNCSVQVGCNFAGCASTCPPAILGGSVAPSIAVQPLSVTLAAGQAATFSVTAAGSPSLTYQWQKNGVNISGATGTTYTTPPVTLADNGAIFTVIVSNSLGGATSTPATLTVKRARSASNTTVTPSMNPSVAGDFVIFTADVQLSGWPVPTGTVRFTTDGTTITGCSAVALSSSLTATCTVPNLAVGSDTIVATYSGDGYYLSSSGMLTQVVDANPTPLQFVPVTPCRVVDTRNPDGPFGGPAIQGNNSRSFAIPQGACNIPSGAAAYSLNVTAVPETNLGYLTIWPTGSTQPLASTLNSYDGRVKANAAIVPAGTPSGSVSVYVTDTTNVILDINGYFIDTSGTLQFYPLTPCRVVDTRAGSQEPQGLGPPSFSAMEVRPLPILTSPCFQNLPQHPQAYSFNVTVVPQPAGQELGYLTIWPSDQQQPYVSTLNNPTATVVANAAIVPAAANGNVSVFTYNSTDVIIDINGYFATAGSGGYSFYPVAPCRALDTRNNNGQPFQNELTVDVVDSPCVRPGSATAYVFNATAVPSGFLDFLTLWPDGQPKPFASTLNAYDGFVTSNMAIVPTTNGSIDAYASQLTQLILDISGYFAP